MAHVAAVFAVALVVAGTFLGLNYGDRDDSDRDVRIVRNISPSISESAAAPLGVAGPPGASEGATEDLAAFVAESGEPPDAAFARVRIPRLGIDAGVSPRVVDAGAAVMPVPDGPVALAWYDLSAWPGLGGRPGEGGNAILAGHVDYDGEVSYAGRSYRGPGVFYALHQLGPGDTIEIEYEGEVLIYAVTWVKQLGVSETDWSSIWSADVERDALTLFTCAGTFDEGLRSYDERLVVRAERT